MSPRELVCLIGWPVAHSLSPAMHNAAFEAVGLDWTYLAVAVRPGAAREGVELLRTLGVAGANVTVPHKQEVIAALDAVDDRARAIGAVNTIMAKDGGLAGANTDADGFVNALREEEGLEPSGMAAVVLGAGGAARAVAMGLAEAGASVTVCARNDAQADLVAALHPSIHAGPWERLPDADLLVQATATRDGLPLDRLPLGEQVVAVDLTYWDPQTPFLEVARAAGARAVDGLGMLLHQAALSFQMWTGRPAPIDVMRRAALGALSERPSGIKAGPPGADIQ